LRKYESAALVDQVNEAIRNRTPLFIRAAAASRRSAVLSRLHRSTLRHRPSRSDRARYHRASRDELGRPLEAALDAAGHDALETGKPETIVTANVGCQMHLNMPEALQSVTGSSS